MDFHLYKLNFKLSEPLSISFHTFYYRENFLLELKYKNHTGFGEAAPFKLITGDGPEDIIKEAKKIKGLPLDPQKNSFEDLFIYLQNTIRSQTLKTAFDFALHDLVGKIKGVPVYKLYTKKTKPVDNSVTIFVKESLEETAQDAKNVFNKYPQLKILKIKLKGKNDIQRAKAIKKVSPSHMKFIVDANQGFSDPKEAVRVLNEIGKILGKVILVEEPCPKGQLDKLKYVTNNVRNILVFADESAATIEDAKKAIQAQAVHGINIKLQKAGGIWPAKQIANMCQKANMKIMVGCMLEGPVGIAAGVHFAVSTPNLILSDLDSDLDMPNHTSGQAYFKNGQRIPSENLGLGVSFDYGKIKKLQDTGEVVYKKII